VNDRERDNQIQRARVLEVRIDLPPARSLLRTSLRGAFHRTEVGIHPAGLLARLKELWKQVPRYKPLSVGVVLLDLAPAYHHQPDLFDADSGRRQKLSPLVIKRALCSAMSGSKAAR
jgi:hypothetical protein